MRGAHRKRRPSKVTVTRPRRAGYTQNAIIHNGVLDADAQLLLKPYAIDDLTGKVRAVLDE